VDDLREGHELRVPKIPRLVCLNRQLGLTCRLQPHWFLPFYVQHEGSNTSVLHWYVGGAHARRLFELLQLVAYGAQDVNLNAAFMYAQQYAIFCM
jgi:hypothetical protein